MKNEGVKMFYFCKLLFILITLLNQECNVSAATFKISPQYISITTPMLCRSTSNTIFVHSLHKLHNYESFYGVLKSTHKNLGCGFLENVNLKVRQANFYSILSHLSGVRRQKYFHQLYQQHRYLE